MNRVFPNIYSSDNTSIIWVKSIDDDSIGGTLQLRNAYDNVYIDLVKYVKTDLDDYQIVHSHGNQTGISIIFAEIIHNTYPTESAMKTQIERILLNFSKTILKLLDSDKSK